MEPARHHESGHGQARDDDYGEGLGLDSGALSESEAVGRRKVEPLLGSFNRPIYIGELQPKLGDVLLDTLVIR